MTSSGLGSEDGAGKPLCLALRGLDKRFGGLQAVQSVDFDVHEGEILGLIGPNGAGKTTLFNLIAGLLKPTGGSITLAGVRIDRMKPNQRCRLGVARTFQIPRPFAALSVRENIEVAARFGRLAGAKTPVSERVERILRQLHLDAWADAPSASLPLGGRKKLELARALATGPRILLLDEVMGGLAAAEVDDVMALIRGIRAEGVTVVLVEHVLRAVMGLADRIVVVNQGRVICVGLPEEVVRDPDVIAAYLGESGAKADA